MIVNGAVGVGRIVLSSVVAASTKPTGYTDTCVPFGATVGIVVCGFIDPGNGLDGSIYAEKTLSPDAPFADGGTVTEAPLIGELVNGMNRDPPLGVNVVGATLD